MHDIVTIRARLRAFLESKFPKARSADLEDNVSLLESGIVDSLGILDLVAFLEGEFKVKVADEDLSPENFGSVGGMCEFVLRQESHSSDRT